MGREPTCSWCLDSYLSSSIPFPRFINQKVHGDLRRMEYDLWLLSIETGVLKVSIKASSRLFYYCFIILPIKEWLFPNQQSKGDRYSPFIINWDEIYQFLHLHFYIQKLINTIIAFFPFFSSSCQPNISTLSILHEWRSWLYLSYWGSEVFNWIFRSLNVMLLGLPCNTNSLRSSTYFNKIRILQDFYMTSVISLKLFPQLHIHLHTNHFITQIHLIFH